MKKTPEIAKFPDKILLGNVTTKTFTYQHLLGIVAGIGDLVI